MSERRITKAQISACLLGTAVGDALGLPYEGLRPASAARILGEPSRHRFFFGRGMISDDSEHAAMVGLALFGSKHDPKQFAKKLAWHLRLWLLAVPAGMGFATLRACVKLLLGFPPSHSGVFSAGNGPAMRAPILGLLARDFRELHALVRASTRITHRDPKAEQGALVVALATRLASEDQRADPSKFLTYCRSQLGELDPDLSRRLDRTVTSVNKGESTEAFAKSEGQVKGVSGYILDTVPICLHAWLSHQGDYLSTVQAVIRCGGDADTSAAIAGGIAGAQCRLEGIPDDLAQKIFDWPIRQSWLDRLAHSLEHTFDEDRSVNAPRPLWLLRIPRNVFFLCVVLTHGLRRLLPA